MYILITNDDGIDSPGLAKLAAAARSYGNVWVVAPDGQRSAMSHSFTWRENILVRTVDFPVEDVTAFSCSGTPADCVRIGALKLLPEKPGIVMAGINTGYNISHDIQYSATVGAVMEAALWGIHAIAFSQGNVAFQDVVDRYLPEIMGECVKNHLGPGQVWNVNFPCCELNECKGIRRDCVISSDPYYADSYEEISFEAGVTAYRLASGRVWKGTPGTDLAAVIDNYISVGIVNNLR